MKKIFIYLFGLLIVFASCAKIEEMSYEDLKNDAPQEIVFNMDAVKVTKAIVTGNKFADGTYFSAFGYIKTATHVVPEQIYGSYALRNAKYYAGGANEGKSATNTKYYWPHADNNQDVKANFVAFFPYAASEDTVKLYITAADGYSEGDVVYKYNIDANKINADSAIDVLYAVNYDFNPGNFPKHGVSNQKVD
jgi:hypothetical protein